MLLGGGFLPHFVSGALDWRVVGPSVWSQYAALRSTNFGTPADTLTTPTGTYPGGAAYFGGVLLPDGRVFCVPHYATSARIYGGALPSNLPAARVLSAYDNKF